MAPNAIGNVINNPVTQPILQVLYSQLILTLILISNMTFMFARRNQDMIQNMHNPIPSQCIRKRNPPGPIQLNRRIRPKSRNINRQPRPPLLAQQSRQIKMRVALSTQLADLSVRRVKHVRVERTVLDDMILQERAEVLSAVVGEEEGIDV